MEQQKKPSILQRLLVGIGIGTLAGGKLKDVAVETATEIIVDEVQKKTDVSLLDTDSRQHIETALKFVEAAGRRTNDLTVLSYLEFAAKELQEVLNGT